MLTYTVGRAIAQAVSRWLSTVAARVRGRFWQVGFMVEKVALGQVFSSVSPATLHSTNCSIVTTITRGRYNRPVVADVPSGLISTPHYAKCKVVMLWILSFLFVVVMQPIRICSKGSDIMDNRFFVIIP
jgi:hypothetical protein